MKQKIYTLTLALILNTTTAYSNKNKSKVDPDVKALAQFVMKHGKKHKDACSSFSFPGTQYDKKTKVDDGIEYMVRVCDVNNNGIADHRDGIDFIGENSYICATDQGLDGFLPNIEDNTDFDEFISRKDNFRYKNIDDHQLRKKSDLIQIIQKAHSMYKSTIEQLLNAVRR